MEISPPQGLGVTTWKIPITTIRFRPRFLGVWHPFQMAEIDGLQKGLQTTGTNWDDLQVPRSPQVNYVRPWFLPHI